MQPIQLWNVIRKANEFVLWTPMWNWNIFSSEILKENYRSSIKESITPIIGKLKFDEVSSNNVSEEIKASSVLFLMYCAITGIKNDLEDYFKLLGREIPPRPEAIWENNVPVSVEDPYEQDRKIPARLLSIAGNVLERYPVGDHGNEAKCRINWEAPIVMDANKKKIILSVWHHIGFSESHLDIWGNRESAKWNTGGDNYAFFLRCVHLLNEARTSHERNGLVLPEDVSPQIRSIVPDLNKEKAWFKQVRASRFLDMNDGSIKLYSKCHAQDDSSVWVKLGYGEEFKLPTDDRLDFTLKFYVDQANRGRQKILGRLPRGTWFFESTENKDVYKMVPKKSDNKEYSYPIIVAIAPSESNRSLIQCSEKYYVGRSKIDNTETGNRYFYRFETESEFGNSLLKLLPTIPVLLRPKRKLHIEYCAKDSENWIPVDNVCIDWPHAPQAHCFAGIQWRKNDTFENADMQNDFRSFAVKDFRLNMDGGNQQGIKIALLPSGFTIKEVYDDQLKLSGVKFYKYGDIELKRDELEMSSIEGDKGEALFNTMDGGLMRAFFDVRLDAPMTEEQKAEIAQKKAEEIRKADEVKINVLRAGSSLESIDELLMRGEQPDDNHIIRVINNGVSLQDLANRRISLSKNIAKKLLFSTEENFIWLVNNGYQCTEEDKICAIKTSDALIDIFVYKGADVSKNILIVALEKRKALWNNIAQWDFNIPSDITRQFFERKGYIESFESPCEKLQQLFIRHNWKNIYRIKDPKRGIVDFATKECDNPAERSKLFKWLDSMPVMTLEEVLRLGEATVLPEYGDGPILPGIVGSRVRHNKCPEWGLGEVIGVEEPHYLKIKFENGPKILTMNWANFGSDPHHLVEFV